MGRPREHDGRRDAAGVAPPVVPMTASRRPIARRNSQQLRGPLLACFHGWFFFLFIALS